MGFHDFQGFPALAGQLELYLPKAVSLEAATGQVKPPPAAAGRRGLQNDSKIRHNYVKMTSKIQFDLLEMVYKYRSTR